MRVRRLSQNLKWKYVNSLFALLFFYAVTPLHAQSLEGEGTPLITDASQLSSNASDEAEGQHIEYLVDGDASTFWHSDYHKKCSDQYHYIQVALNEAFTGEAAIWFYRRNTDKDHPTEFLIQGSVDGITWVDIAKVALPFNGKGTIAQSDFFTVKDPVNYLRFSATNCTGTTNEYRTFWHASEFQIYAVEHSSKLMIALNNLLLKYDAYLWGDEIFNMGSEYGQYTNTEAAATFIEKLQEVENISAGTIPLPSSEEVEALIQSVEDAYASVLASEVIFQIPTDGYYRIYTNLNYYVTSKTGEKDADGNDIIERKYVTKALYSDLAGYGCWGTYDENDCRFVWKLTKDSENPAVIDMVNAATDFRFKNWGSPITMGEDGELKVIFDWVGIENGHDVFYIRNSDLAPDINSKNYIHQWNHNKGTGTSYQLTAWKGTFNMGEPYTSDKGSSEWYMESVSEEEALALVEAFKHHDVLVLRYKDLLAQAQDAILKSQDASSITKVLSDTPLISNANQLSSPVTESSEGSIQNLLDGNASTFWHSDYHHNYPDPIHYLYVELPEAYQGALSLFMARRYGAANDHPIKMQVGASNDGENWTDITQITAPYEGNTTSCSFTPFKLDQPYKFVRFGALDCTGDTYSFRTFWHAGEIQLYPATILGKTQFENMGEIATTLASLVEKASSQNDADVTVADYDALNDAYETFIGNLVDPSTLVAALNNAMNIINTIQIGNAPGFWADESAKTQAQALIDEAQAYCQAGSFDKANVDEYTKKLNSVKNDLLAQANKVQTNKWYRIRHMNEEEYTVCGVSTSYTNLYGQYLAVGYLQKEMVDDTEADVAHTYTSYQTRDGQNIFFFNEEDIMDTDAALFRFVELPDGRYAMQNKASGLFISRAAEEADILMGFTPQSFEVRPIGYGQVLFVMQNLDGSTFSRPNLNANANNATYSVLRWWDDSNFGCNSTFIIEEAEDVDEDYTPVLKKDMVMGQFYPMFCPMAVQPSEGTIYQVEGTFVDDEKNYVAMNELEESSKAGVPFVYMLGTPEDYNEESPETMTVEFTLGTDFDLQLGTAGGFKGVYSYRVVPEGTLVFSGNKVISADATVTGSQNVLGGTGFINFGEVEADAEASGDYSLVMEVGGEMKENPLAALGKPLITDASQLSSNAPDQAEGTNIAALIDGVPSTFWHSDWHGEYDVDSHYLQVELNEEFTGDLTVVMTRRNIDNNHPTAMDVLGSLDGENYFTVTSLDLPFEGPATVVVSETFGVREPIKYLRFVVTNTGSTAADFTFRKYWHTAEFQLYGIQGDAVERIEKSKTAQMGIFTINGIRVEKTQQGLYIIDGRKIFVK